jgi:hypothetical protein
MVRSCWTKIAVFWDVAPCSPVIALKMEAVNTSETSVNIYQTTRRNIPEDSHLHTRLRENPKSHQIFNSFNMLSCFLVLTLLSSFSDCGHIAPSSNQQQGARSNHTCSEDSFRKCGHAMQTEGEAS